MFKESNKNFEIWCNEINWINSAACGNAKTLDEYRSNGLYTHTLSKIFQYLNINGKNYFLFFCKKK